MATETFVKKRVPAPLRRLRFSLGIIVIAGLAAASHPGKLGQDTPQRKTTEAPVPAKGKMGQDLFLAIDHRDLAGIKSLLANGADPNSRNGLEFTPIFIAAASHQTDAMEALIAGGANPEAKSQYGTALTFAAEGGNVEGANLLLSLGSDVNFSRIDGITVLMMAAESGSPEIAGELIKRGAKVNKKDLGGLTALNFAARGGNTEVARQLLNAGAAVDVADGERQTPLMAASATGHAELVQLLLKKGANPNARDNMGRTALILSAQYADSPQVVRALLRSGADPKAVDANGCSASALASVRGHERSLALLGPPTAKALAAATTRRNPSQAVKASLKLVQASMMEFSQSTSCVSCHQEGIGRIATGEAGSRGFHLDPAVQGAQMGRINGMLKGMQPLHEQALKDPETMKQVPLIEINEVATLDSWLLCGMAAQHQAPDAANGAMAMVLARQQTPSGCWAFSIPRVPLQSSPFTFTALTARALSTYAPKANVAEIGQRIKRAKAWLLQTPTKTSEDRASQLLGLKWTGAGVGARSKTVAAIRADQRADGGWSQLPNLASDAYATGQALYAMHVGGGVPVTDPVYQRGVRFLLRTQDRDGSWFVNKRAMPANNYFDSAFPHGESQYSSFNGTCWAMLALLETIGPK